MTLKKALLRGLNGITLGVTIGYLVTILISFFVADGYYAPVVPSFAEFMGSEILAVALQFILCGFTGFAFALASGIWEVEHWSLARQTVLHFLAISLGLLPVAWLCRWTENMPGGILCYFGVFAAVYGVLWLLIVATIRKKVKAVNDKLQGR